jgi:hypothetical protein
MSPYLRIALGYVFSIIVGHFVIGPYIKWLWRYLAKHGHEVTERHTNPRGALSLPLGILERGIYTGALMIGMWQLIGAWLLLKVAARWKETTKYRGADNVWLIGNGLSLVFGFLGACIALGHLPVIR